MNGKQIQKKAIDLFLPSENNKSNKMIIKIGKRNDKDKINKNILSEKGKEKEKKIKILQLKEKNKELLLKYENMKSKIKISKNDLIKLESDYNLKIKEDDIEIESLNKDYLYLKRKIKELKTNLKKTEEKNIKWDINQEINYVNDLIELNNNKIKDHKSQCEELKKKIKDATSPNQVDNLRTELDKINTIKNNIIEEIENIKSMNNKHKKNCNKIKNDLLIQLNILKREYEYEIKRKKNINNNNNIEELIINICGLNHCLYNLYICISLFIFKCQDVHANNNNVKKEKIIGKNKSQSLLFNEKKNKIIIREKTTDTLMNNQDSFKKYFLNIKNKNSKNCLNTSNNHKYFSLKQNMNSPFKGNINIHKNIIKNNSNTKNTNKNIKIKVKKKLLYNLSNNQFENRNTEDLLKVNLSQDNNIYNNNIHTKNDHALFTPSEKRTLSSLIPNQYLDIYEKRFNSIEEQRDNILTKLNESNPQKEMLKNNLNKIEISKNKLEDICKRNIILNSRLILINKKICIIQNNIKKNKDDLMRLNLKLNIKNNRYDELIKSITEFKKSHKCFNK